MPGYSVPIKARMLYSSCKAPLLELIESEFEITLDKKVSATEYGGVKRNDCRFTPQAQVS